MRNGASFESRIISGDFGPPKTSQRTTCGAAPPAGNGMLSAASVATLLSLSTRSSCIAVASSCLPPCSFFSSAIAKACGSNSREQEIVSIEAALAGSGASAKPKKALRSPKTGASSSRGSKCTDSTASFNVLASRTRRSSGSCSVTTAAGADWNGEERSSQIPAAPSSR
jgi:hypothetical protein